VPAIRARHRLASALMSSSQSSLIVASRASICSINSKNGLAVDVERRRDSGTLIISGGYRPPLSHATLSTMAICRMAPPPWRNGWQADAHPHRPPWSSDGSPGVCARTVVRRSRCRVDRRWLDRSPNGWAGTLRPARLSRSRSARRSRSERGHPSWRRREPDKLIRRRPRVPGDFDVLQAVRIEFDRLDGLGARCDVMPGLMVPMMTIFRASGWLLLAPAQLFSPGH